MHNELNRISSKPKYQEINCEKEIVNDKVKTIDIKSFFIFIFFKLIYTEYKKYQDTFWIEC